MSRGPQVPRAVVVGGSVGRALARGWGVVPVAAIAGLLALRAALAVAPLARLAPEPALDGDPIGTAAVGGALAAVRGGPYIFGFDSPGDARLRVDGHDVVGRGHVTARVVLTAGAKAIHLAAPPGTRLVWSPPGRRGDPEYLPASSLAPAPPAQATFGDDVGAARTDGILALLLLAVIAATVGGLARHRLARVPRAAWLGMGAVLLVALAARWIDLGGAGQTWDEDVNWAAARNLVSNVLALDGHQASWLSNYEHPPVLKYLDGAGALLADGYGPARALSALWVALGAALLVPIGARLWRLRVGVLAGLVAALLPPLIAHGKVVGHEAPTVLWWSLGLVAALGVWDDHDGAPVTPWRWRLRLAALGGIVGVAVASRFVNAPLAPLCGWIVVIQAPTVAPAWTGAWWRVHLRVIGALAAIVPVVAVLTVVALWPRLWSEPLLHLRESWAKLSHPHGTEPFLGAITNTPGPHYFLVYLLATTPLAALLAALGGAVRIARAAGGDLRARRAQWIVLAWLVHPLAVMASPVRQDGVRYVMPLVVLIAVLAAVGVDALAAAVTARLARRARPAGSSPGRDPFRLLAAALVLYLGVVAARIHPYYLDYFGEQVGGAETVAARRWFEVGWWGEGVDRAVAYVDAHAAVGARVYRGCIEPLHLAWFRQDLWEPMAQQIGDAEWIVTYEPLARPCPVPAAAQRVFEVRAGGAVIAEVFQVARPAPTRP